MAKKKKKETIKQLLQRKQTSRRILRPHQATMVVSNKEIENTFDAPNRFFKGQMEAAKKSMFF